MKAESAVCRAVLAWLLLAVPAAATADNLRLTDFAYAVGLETPGEGALYRLDLPEVVYRGATRRDLADVRVFNAAGMPVPYALTPGGRELEQTVATHDLPLFPLPADTPWDSESVRLWVRGDRAGADIRLHRASGERGETAGYLLDARSVPSRVDRFTFRWDDAAFMVKTVLEASDDLQHWRTLATGAVLADLTHAGHRLRRDRIQVAPVQADFYRLRFADPERGMTLTAVRVQGTHQLRIERAQRLDVPVERGEGAGVYTFEIPPALTPSRLRIALPEINTLAPARLLSRPAAGEPWREHQRLTLYRLRQNGVELENEDIALGARRDRHWRLEVEQSGGGLGEGLPEMTLFWRPHELRFVARGEGPFTLAWGSARPMDAPRLQRPLSGSAGMAPLPASIDGNFFRPAGDAVLRPPLDWRRWLLWGVLVIGALSLLWMALRLYRQMNQ